MRDTSDVAPFLLLALLLTVVGLAGAAIRARATGRLRRLVRTDLSVVAVGVALLVLGMVLGMIAEIL